MQRELGALDAPQAPMHQICIYQLNGILLKEFTPGEVKFALHSIGDLKAPGPDGMPLVFYKSN